MFYLKWWGGAGLDRHLLPPSISQDGSVLFSFFFIIVCLFSVMFFPLVVWNKNVFIQSWYRAQFHVSSPLSAIQELLTVRLDFILRVRVCVFLSSTVSFSFSIVVSFAFVNHLAVCFLQIWSVHCGYFSYMHVFSCHILLRLSFTEGTAPPQVAALWGHKTHMFAEEGRAEVAQRHAWVATCFGIMTAIGIHLGSTSACVAVFKVRFPSFCSCADTIKKVAHYCL